LCQGIDDISVSPEQNFPVTGCFHYDIFGHNDGYEIQSDKGEIIATPDINLTILRLYYAINIRVLGAFPMHLKLHAGCATLNGKRFIFVGDKLAGKTTLACWLICKKMSVQCDEIVLLGEDLKVISFPRPFHVKDGTLTSIPQMRKLCRHMHRYMPSTGRQVRFFDPRHAGFEWKITVGKPDTIFYLKPNHNGISKLEKIPQWQMVHNIFRQASYFSLNPGSQISTLVRLVNETNCFQLLVGDLEGAEKIIHNVINGDAVNGDIL